MCGEREDMEEAAEMLYGSSCIYGNVRGLPTWNNCLTPDGIVFECICRI